MNEDGAMVTQMDLVEIVHIELSDERGETVMTEVLGENDLLQFLLVEDADAL